MSSHALPRSLVRLATLMHDDDFVEHAGWMQEGLFKLLLFCHDDTLKSFLDCGSSKVVTWQSNNNSPASVRSTNKEWWWNCLSKVHKTHIKPSSLWSVFPASCLLTIVKHIWSVITETVAFLWPLVVPRTANDCDCTSRLSRCSWAIHLAMHLCNQNLWMTLKLSWRINNLAIDRDWE